MLDRWDPGALLDLVLEAAEQAGQKGGAFDPMPVVVASDVRVEEPLVARPALRLGQVLRSGRGRRIAVAVPTWARPSSALLDDAPPHDGATPGRRTGQ